MTAHAQRPAMKACGDDQASYSMVRAPSAGFAEIFIASPCSLVVVGWVPCSCSLVMQNVNHSSSPRALFDPSWACLHEAIFAHSCAVCSVAMCAQLLPSICQIVRDSEVYKTGVENRTLCFRSFVCHSLMTHLHRVQLVPFQDAIQVRGRQSSLWRVRTE